jgi:hypothetical protein
LAFVLRRAAFTIAGVGRNAVAEVIDAHLETLSMFFLTTLWAVGYGWVEGTVGIGAILGQLHIPWFGRFSLYHFVLGLTVFAISFSFGLLKFQRMLYYRKRYMLFTAVGNYPYGLVAQDFAYFWFIPGSIRLDAMQWTCQGLGLGCWQLYNPWTTELYFFPRWYLFALTLSGICFFLAYRSALVNLLITREVAKQSGFLEKTRIGATEASNVTVTVTTMAGKERPTEQPPAPLRIEAEESQVRQKITQIVDKEREDLIRRLRERLERQGE